MLVVVSIPIALNVIGRKWTVITTFFACCLFSAFFCVVTTTGEFLFSLSRKVCCKFITQNNFTSLSIHWHMNGLSHVHLRSALVRSATVALITSWLFYFLHGRSGPLQLGQLPHCGTWHRDAFCQFSFRWIHYYGSNKSTGLETCKSHLCAWGYKESKGKSLKSHYSMLFWLEFAIFDK